MKEPFCTTGGLRRKSAWRFSAPPAVLAAVAEPRERKREKMGGEERERGGDEESKRAKKVI